MSAALSLRAAVYEKLRSDPAVAALLGADRIFDEVPEAMRAPFVVLGAVDSRAYGGDPAEGEEHRLNLDVWSRAPGMAEALGAAGAVASCLDGARVQVVGHHLVNLAWLGTDARRTGDGRHRLASLRFRAVTEPG